MKALIIRYGAYGDVINMSHLPRLLKDIGFKRVDVETNYKGYQILNGNPFIDNLRGINPEVIFNGIEWMVEKHWQVEAEKYDYFINLTNSIEYSLLAMEDQNIYFMSNKARKQRYKDVNFIDQSTICAGFPELVGKYNGEIYFTDKEHEIVKKWLKKFEGKFTVLINLSGTGPHKRMVQAKEISEKILKQIPEAHIITTGSPNCSKYDFPSDRVTSIVGKMPFRQALLISKYVNCVMGCESGIMCGATVFHTPTVQLMTAASIENHCKYNPNDYSLQSPAYCSPCYKGPYHYWGCPHKDGNPLCVYFDVEEIIKKVKEIYAKWR